MKKWSSQCSERNLCNCERSQKKIQDFNGVWTRDLAITDAMWSYTEISRSEKGVKCVNHDIILEFVFVR